MLFSPAPRNFDHTTLATMRQAFDEVCMMLGVQASDLSKRQRVAMVIISGANAGAETRDRLREHAMRSLTQCGVG